MILFQIRKITIRALARRVQDILNHQKKLVIRIQVISNRKVKPITLRMINSLKINNKMHIKRNDFSNSQK